MLYVKRLRQRHVILK